MNWKILWLYLGTFSALQAQYTIRIYTADWCGPCHELKSRLIQQNQLHFIRIKHLKIPIEWIDIDQQKMDRREKKTEFIPEIQLRFNQKFLSLFVTGSYYRDAIGIQRAFYDSIQ